MRYSMRYVDEFLKCNCAPDVLAAVGKMNNAAKEITESMAIIRRLRRASFKHPMELKIVDLCAGNALTSITAVHLLPFKTAVAVDLKPRSGKYNLAERFLYMGSDIKDCAGIIDKNTILVAVHPCGKAAEQVMQLYLDSNAMGVIIMPCCISSFKFPSSQMIAKLIGSYKAWAYHLSMYKGLEGKLGFDGNVLSPCNAIVEHWRRR